MNNSDVIEKFVKTFPNVEILHLYHRSNYTNSHSTTKCNKFPNSYNLDILSYFETLNNLELLHIHGDLICKINNNNILPSYSFKFVKTIAFQGEVRTYVSY